MESLTHLVVETLVVVACSLYLTAQLFPHFTQAPLLLNLGCPGDRRQTISVAGKYRLLSIGECEIYPQISVAGE